MYDDKLLRHAMAIVLKEAVAPSEAGPHSTGRFIKLLPRRLG